MDYEQYIKALFGLQTSSENILLGRLPVLQRIIINTVTTYIEENFDFKNGRMIISSDNNASIKKFSPYFRNALLQENGFIEGLITRYVKEIKKTDKLIESFQKQNGGIDLKKIKLSPGRQLIYEEIINQFEKSGMEDFLTQPLRDAIFLGVSQEMTLKELKELVRKTVKGDGKKPGNAEKYLETISRNGLSSYTGMVNKKLMETFKFNAMIMSGSLIETSSPQCIYGIEDLKGIIKKTDWPKLRRKAKKNGLVPGTTFYNLPFNLLHYNCRHTFTPTIVKS